MTKEDKLLRELCRLLAAIYSYRSFVQENFTGSDLALQERRLSAAMNRAHDLMREGR